MLSRIAESLYWLGRYLERAEDTARLLDIHVHLLLEDSEVHEEEFCSAILAALDVKPPEDQPPAIADVLELLAYRPDGPICGSLAAARENARAAREVLSADMWECLNSAHNALPGQLVRAHREGPHGFFRYVEERAAILWGLAESTLSRDDSWRFLVFGRSLERVDMTARIIGFTRPQEASAPALVALLRSCAGHSAYLRTYRSGVDAARVTQFLVLDRLFPRSLFHALSEAEEQLAALQPDLVARTGVSDHGRMALGRVRTMLEFGYAGDLQADLPQLLAMQQRACAEVHNSVATRFFRPAIGVQWSAEVTS